MKKEEKVNQKKLLIIAPVFVLLVCAGVFYALGGGSTNAGAPVIAGGINRSLPDADFKKAQPTDKMGIYELAGKDSATVRSITSSPSLSGLGFPGNVQEQDQTQEINAKLEALNREISKPEHAGLKVYTNEGTSRSAHPGMKSDVDRLEALMKTMQESRGEDPEVTQLNGMLDKILSIQNPELVQERLKSKVKMEVDSQFKAIPAIIVQKQKVGQGASVKIRLLDTLRISGILIPKGHELFAVTRLANHRLLLDVSNIRLGTSIVPVNLSVYSMDGMAGIDAPEAELNNAARGGVNDAFQGMQFLSMDQSIGVQAAGAGIDAAKNLLSKKVRKIKVPLQGGMKVLLRNNQPQRNGYGR
jgi:hypothetical protein